MSMNKWFIIGITLLSFALLFGFAILVSESGSSPEEKSTALTVTEKDWTYGNKDSKVVVVEYLDFQCPACARVYPMTEKIKDEYKDRVLFVVRNFPLPNHSNGLISAKFVEASGKQGKYWEMYKLMYERQENWSESKDPASIFQSYAKELKLDISKLNVDINSEEIKNKIETDISTAKIVGVNETPTFYLNGSSMKTPSDLTSFKKLLDDELKK